MWSVVITHSTIVLMIPMRNVWRKRGMFRPRVAESEGYLMHKYVESKVALIKACKRGKWKNVIGTNPSTLT